MTVRLKLMVIILFVGLVPISIQAWTALGIHQRAAERTLSIVHEAAGSREALRVQSRLQNLHDSIKQLATNTPPWDALPADELRAAEWLIYRADADVVAVLLLDAERQLASQPAYLTDATSAEEPHHLPQSPAIVPSMVEHLPLGGPSSATNWLGSPFLVAADQAPILPLRVQVPTTNAAQKQLHLAIGVSMRTICKPVTQPDGIRITIIDTAQRDVCDLRQVGPVAPIGTVRANSATAGQSVGILLGRDGQEVVGATVALPFGWRIATEQSADSAYAASRQLRGQAILWTVVSLAVALSSGLLLARGISKPVQRLVEGSRQLALGNLEYRIVLPEEDEFGHLGRAFNDMATDIAARDRRIREWNAELKEKVQERTRALEKAHVHLVQAEKESVMARLCAGVASQINDPLTGILGALQILQSRSKRDPAMQQEARLCANAEEGARHICDVIKRVQALGQRQPESQRIPLSIQDLLGSVVELVSEALAAANVELVRLSNGPSPSVVGSVTQLEQALLQVLNNAIASCLASDQESGTLALGRRESGTPDKLRRHRVLIQTSLVEERMVQIAISDDGVGIPPQQLERVFEPFVTLRADSGAGLGLTIARRIIEEHGGTLVADTNDVRGANLRCRLPVVERRGRA